MPLSFFARGDFGMRRNGYQSGSPFPVAVQGVWSIRCAQGNFREDRAESLWPNSAVRMNFLTASGANIATFIGGAAV